MFDFDVVLITTMVAILVMLLTPIVARKKKALRDHAKIILIAFLPILVLCVLAFICEWESDMLNIHPEGSLCAELEIKGFDPNSDCFYSDISYGSCVKIASKVYVGGQYVNLPSGESGYYYKLQATEP